jgi:hypothetical protein
MLRVTNAYDDCHRVNNSTQLNSPSKHCLGKPRRTSKQVLPCDRSEEEDGAAVNGVNWLMALKEGVDRSERR